MLGLIKKTFIGLLTGLVNRSNHTKFMWLSNQKHITQATVINFYPNEYSQHFYNYPFAVKLDRYVGSSTTLNYLSNKVCVPSKTEDLNLCVFNMFTGINAPKTLTKHISCKCKHRFNGRKCNSDQFWNNNNYWCEWKNCHACDEKVMFWILLHVVVKMENI